MAEDQLIEAIARFDAVNAEDPNQETIDGVQRPKELVYAERMSAWLDKLAPDASEVVRLAVRAQHIRRWTVEREGLPSYATSQGDTPRHPTSATEAPPEGGLSAFTGTSVRAKPSSTYDVIFETGSTS